MNEFAVVTGPDVVRIERELPGPIERVWAYLTESELRCKWLAAGPMELRVGGAVALHFQHSELSPVDDPIPKKYESMRDGQAMSGRVTQCDPPRLLSYTWGEDSGEESEVTFELAPRNNDVLLVVTHRRLATRDDMISVAGGWHTHLGILIDVLNARTPPGFWTAHSRIEGEYRRRFAAPAASTSS
jgi:uncharacterized protein YndB with AHSA1/START domain